MSEQAGAERSAVEFEATGEQAAAEEETQHVPAESEAGVEREAAEAGAEQAVGEFGGGRTATGDEAELSVPDAFADGAWQAAEPAAMVDAPVPVEGTAPDEVGEARAEAMDAVSGAQEAGQVEPVPEEAASGIPAQGRRGGRGGGAVGGASTRTEEEVELKPLDEGELRAALEAILLVVDEPVAEMQLAQIVEQPTERVAAMLEDISARYTAAGHGFDLRRAAGGWRLYTRPEYAEYVERFVLDGQSVRLTQAALETLAVVAYKQPVTRSRISAIRGVNCDGVMRTLVTRGLIEECGVEGETGAFLYRTTALFLEKLGLNSVDQLPPLAPFLPDDVEEVLDASG
ncbi:SMC-Scp complex subunit ScpB [Actinoplanes sp. NPDC051859]|uniref:SMC-Scp complex subunit ScpB n=1 Tax=Actinoplanes sp. NPDC051859 TaxID=3363909 RepID=UPI0037BC3BA0